MNARHLSSETIDLMLMSALALTQASDARVHLDTCALCQKRWSELNEDKAHFEQYIFPRTVGKLEERLRGASRLRALWRYLLPAAGVAVAASLAGITLRARVDPSPAGIYLGLKGGSQLEVVASRPAVGQFAVRPGTVLHPKDKIEFVVNGAGQKYLLIATRDGNGAFTVYYPFGATESGEVQPGRVQLPSSVELDEVVGPERLVAVFSEAPVRADVVKTALEANLKDPKIDRAKVVSWEFVKSR